MRQLSIFLLAACVVSASAAASTTTTFAPGFNSPPDQPYGWVVAPPGRPFPPLSPDPRDIKMGLRKNNKHEIEADVGGYRSFAGWKGDVKNAPMVLHVGIEGNAYFLMHQEGAKFPLHSSDGLIGLYGESVRGDDMFQARYTHISAHLSDGLFDVREKILYTREFLSLRYARQIGWTKPYVGYSLLTHTSPALPKHAGQLGFLSTFPIRWGHAHPYAGADLKLRSKVEGTTYNLTGGLAFVSDLGAPPIRVSMNYLKGHDLRGQFYNEETEKFSVGLELDL